MFGMARSAFLVATTYWPPLGIQHAAPSSVSAVRHRWVGWAYRTLLSLSDTPSRLVRLQPFCIFCASKFDLSAREVAILDDSQVKEATADFSTFDTIMRKYATYVPQARGDIPEMDREDRNNLADGGGLQPPLMATGGEECADFGSPLVRAYGKRADAYGFRESCDVRHGRTKCSKRGRNARHWYSYRCNGKRELSSMMTEEAMSYFATPTSGAA